MFVMKRPSLIESMGMKNGEGMMVGDISEEDVGEDLNNLEIWVPSEPLC